MKLEGIVCDCCGSDVTNFPALQWERRPSVFNLVFPRDGVNGGIWSMDVCACCRESLYDAITDKITELRHDPEQWGKRKGTAMNAKAAAERLWNDRSEVLHAFRAQQTELREILAILDDQRMLTLEIHAEVKYRLQKLVGENTEGT